jgi:hypothetical protein
MTLTPLRVNCHFVTYSYPNALVLEDNFYDVYRHNVLSILGSGMSLLCTIRDGIRII